MSLTWVVIVEYIHVFAAIIWFGGVAYTELVVMPALLKQPAAAGKAMYAAVSRYAAPVGAASGILTLLLGIARGTIFGPIQSVDDLFGAAYGRTYLVALIVTLVLVVWGATWHGRRLGPLWEGDQLRPGIAQRVRAGAIFEFVAFAIVLLCMVLMSSGL